MNRKKEKYKVEGKGKKTEDTTKYGEFISSTFSWITLDEQKEKANEMESMTKK